MAQTPAPSIPELALGGDTGRSDTDGITDIGTPTLSGTAAPGAAITLYDSDGVTPFVPSGIADANGFWSIAVVGVLDDGFHEITAVATLPGQAPSVKSPPLAVVIDTAPPDPPTAPDLPAAQDTGMSAMDGVTSKQVLQLTGHTEPNAIITLYNSVAEPPPSTVVHYSASLGFTTAGADGSYTLTSAALPDGSYNLVVTATDVAGNAGKPSGAAAITVDSTAPAAPAAPTLSPGTDTGVSHSDGLTDDGSPVVVGTAEANATVEMFDGAKMVGKATADGTGAYAITSDKLDDGAHALTVKAVDAAGNASAPSAPLNVVIDTTAPAGASSPALVDLGAGSVPFTVHFSEAVTGVTASDFTLVATNTVSGSVQSVTGSGSDYTVTVSGLDGQGTIGLALVAGSVTDLAGNAATLSESDTHAVSGTTQPSTTEVSVTPSGLLVTGTDPSPSASGRLVAFTTLNADELTGGPATDGVANVVVRDTLLGKTALVSLDLDDKAANGSSGGASISADGTEIAFVSDATNFVDVPTQAGEANVYVAEVTEGPDGPDVKSIILVSEGAGEQGEGVNPDGSEAFDAPVLSADGSTVAFDSTQALVKGAESGVENVYAANVATGAITLVSGGTGMDEYGYTQVLDPGSGEYVTELVPEPNKAPGTGGDLNSDVTSISADGKLIAYESTATDLGGLPVQVTDEVVVPSRGYVYNTATGLTTDYSDGQNDVYDPVVSGNGSTVFYEDRSVVGVQQVQDLYEDSFATGAVTPVSVDSAANGFEIYDFGTSASKGGGLVLFQENPGLYTDQTPYQAILGNPATGTMTALTPGYAEALSSAGNAYVFSEPDPSGVYQLYETNLGVSVGVDPISGDDAVDASVLAKAAAGGGLAVSGTTNAPRGVTVAVQIFGASETTNTLSSPAVLGTVDGLGHWTATVPTALLQSADGNYALVVQVGTPAGNSFFSVRDFIVDTKAPDAPDAPKLDAGSDTSLASDGSATSQDMPVVTGTTEGGATITLYDSLSATPDSPVGTATADGDGVYAVSPTAPLINGKHELTVTATDAAGNASAMSDALTVTVDTIAPDAPNAPMLKPAPNDASFAGSSFDQAPPPQGSDTGRSDTDGITMNASPTLIGTAEPNSMVMLYDTDDISVIGTAKANAKGAWEITPGNALAEGAHTLTITATDAAGNASPRSAGLAVVIDTLPPIAPAITSVAGDTVDMNELAPIVDVTGTAEPDSVVTLTLDGAMDGLGADFGRVTASDDGSFTVTSLSIPAGQHKLQVTATDVAGNVSQPSLPVYETIADLAKVPPIGSDQGNVQDGYISGSTVFADANGDGVPDAGEASAVTDFAGLFALSGGSGELVATGGVDITTGLRPTLTLTAPAGSSVIDPLTTLLDAFAALTDADPRSVQAQLVAALGLPADTDLTTLDPSAALLAGDGLPAVLDAKIMDTLTDFQAYLAGNGIIESDGFAAGFTAIAHAVARTIASLPAGQTLELDGGSSLEAIFEDAAGPSAGPLDTPIGGNSSGVTTVAAFGNEALTADLQAGGSGLAAAVAATETVYQGAAATALAGVGTSAAAGAQVINLYDTSEPLSDALANNVGLTSGPPSLAVDTGRSDADDVIDIETPTFVGAALPGTEVALVAEYGFPDGNVEAVTVVGVGAADALGRYSITAIPLDTYGGMGTNGVAANPRAYAIGVVGAAPTQDITFTVGQTLQVLDTTPLLDVTVDSVAPAQPMITDATVAAAPGDDSGHAALYVFGSVAIVQNPLDDEGATISVYADGDPTPVATSSAGFDYGDPNGSSSFFFGLTTTPLSDGPHVLTVSETLAGGTIVQGATSYAVTVASPSIVDGEARASGSLEGARVYDAAETLQPYTAGSAIFGSRLVPTLVQTIDPVDTVEAVSDGTGAYQIAEPPDSDVLAATGGRDTLTGLPLGGALAQIDPYAAGSYGNLDTQAGSLLAPIGSTAVSPLTSIEALLLQTKGGASGAATLAGFGLSSGLDLATLDPVAEAQAGDVRPFLVSAELLDTVTMLAPFIGFDFAPIAYYVGKTGALDLTSAADVVAMLTASYTGLPHLTGVTEQALATVIADSNEAIESHASAAVSLADTLSYTLAAETVAQESTTAALLAAVVAAGASGADLTAVTDGFTGANLSTAVAAARAGSAQATAFVAAGPLTTSAASVDFTLGFGTPVTGLTAADFKTVTGGDLVGTRVTGLAPVAGSDGRNYDVTVATGAGSGSLALGFAPGASLRAGSFSPSSNALLEPAAPVIDAGGTGYGVTIGDLNGDGRPDAVLVSDDGNGENQLTVLLNQGGGSFVAAAPILSSLGGNVTNAQETVAIGDFNGDGKPDLLAVEGSPVLGQIQVAVLPGEGDGTFGTPIITGTAERMTDGAGEYAFTKGVAVGDFNHDGRLDIAIAGAGSSSGFYGSTSGDTVNILLGDGDGTFRAGQGLDTQTFGGENDAVTAVATADLNNDGNLDIAALNYDGDDVDLYLGNGDGTFRAAPSLTFPTGGNRPGDDGDALAIGDVNGDGTPDIVVLDGYPYGAVSTLHPSGSVAVFLGKGDGAFTSLAPFNLPSIGASSSEQGSIALADFNGDGRLDLVVNGSSGTEVLDGDGDGAFTPSYATSDGASGSVDPDGGGTGLAVTDVNGDGRPDVLVAGAVDAETDEVGAPIGLEVLLNASQTVLGSTSQAITVDRPSLAAPALSEASGGGTFTHSGNTYTLDLGTLAFGAATTAAFSLANTAAAPADSFDGTFSDPAGSGFTVAGASLPQALGAGQSYAGLSFTANAGTAGAYSETITFAPRDATTVYATVAAPDPESGAVLPAATSVVDPVAAELPAITLTVIADVMPCFHAGTRIAKPDGWSLVEDLRVGDLVSVASGGARPVVWVGRRRVDCTRHPRPELVHPVRVAAGAFGPRLPKRDLVLSPDHAVFAEGVLIPIKRLVNGASVAVEPRASVDYLHIELDRHDVVLAEGLPTESYLDTGDRDRFEGGACVALHPIFRPAFGRRRAARRCGSWGRRWTACATPSCGVRSGRGRRNGRRRALMRRAVQRRASSLLPPAEWREPDVECAPINEDPPGMQVEKDVWTSRARTSVRTKLARGFRVGPRRGHRRSRCRDRRLPGPDCALRHAADGDPSDGAGELRAMIL